EVKVPADKYWGAQTQRSKDNFKIGDGRMPKEIVQAFGYLKKAAAATNLELGVLPEEKAYLIMQVCDEIIEGKLDDEFPLVVWQTGSGTQTNMNLNEVIANRALELMGYGRGRYDVISPNDHVNMAQSTNDTFPTAMYIAVHRMNQELSRSVEIAIRSLLRKGEEFKGVIKIGRTHLQDAMPVTLGQEFRAYGEALARVNQELIHRNGMLLVLPIGGTATGTGINTHPEYKQRVIDHLVEITGLHLTANPSGHEAMQSTTRVLSVASANKELAVELGRIANDLRLMSSGPTSGLSEITLPAVQPGSSIMPGKVNPVILECLNQICFVVIGNETAITQAAGAGQFELNVMMPMMANITLRSAEYLKNYLPIVSEKCIDGIEADQEALTQRALQNPALATLLNRRIGYLKAAEIAKESMLTGRSVMKIVTEMGILSDEEIRILFDVRSMVGQGGEPDRSQQ
ncbi:MAG: aspartate ammonia-lyase, partial [Thermoplasmata archaeon]|nr:aspartate ammonia-lyase [Thermoplasmata archaeon]